MIMDAQIRCICKLCPSYVNCGESLAFCQPEIGKSSCINTKSGCVCPGCPIYDEKKFTLDYFCIIGSAEISG